MLYDVIVSPPLYGSVHEMTTLLPNYAVYTLEGTSGILAAVTTISDESSEYP